jgi:hypothetical protein
MRCQMYPEIDDSSVCAKCNWRSFERSPRPCESQEHPDYHQGFHDAQCGEPLFGDCPSTQYRAGWHALHSCRALALSSQQGNCK